MKGLKHSSTVDVTWVKGLKHSSTVDVLQIFTTTSVEIGCFFRMGFLKTLFAASMMLVERVLSAGFPFLSVGSKE